jgi:hypothetical protein
MNTDDESIKTVRKMYTDMPKEHFLAHKNLPVEAILGWNLIFPEKAITTDEAAEYLCEQKRIEL